MRTSVSSFESSGRARSSRNLINIDEPHHSRTSHFQNTELFNRVCIDSLKWANWLVRFRGVGRLRQAESAPFKHKIPITYCTATNELKGVLYLWPQCFEVSNEYLIRSWLLFLPDMNPIHLLRVFRSAPRILQTNRFRNFTSCQVSASFTELLISLWHSFILFYNFF